MEECTENWKSEKWKSENGKWGPHPRATMQKHEKKRVAGGASCKLLKIKVQICKEERKGKKSESQTVRNGGKPCKKLSYYLLFVNFYLQIVGEGQKAKPEEKDLRRKDHGDSETEDMKSCQVALRAVILLV